MAETQLEEAKLRLSRIQKMQSEQNAEDENMTSMLAQTQTEIDNLNSFLGYSPTKLGAQSTPELVPALRNQAALAAQYLRKLFRLLKSGLSEKYVWAQPAARYLLARLRKLGLNCGNLGLLGNALVEYQELMAEAGLPKQQFDEILFGRSAGDVPPENMIAQLLRSDLSPIASPQIGNVAMSSVQLSPTL